MKRIFLIAALFALPAFTAQAQITTDQLVEAYKAKGYDSIEVTAGPTQIKVEAIMGGQKIEVIYDAETGDILKSETSAVEPGDDIRPGVSVRNKSKDFVKESRSADDSSDDDMSDDDGSDDHGSDDNGGDDIGSDDNGGDDNSSDDNGGDDNGGDDDSTHDSDSHDSGDDHGSDDHEDGGDED